MSKKILLVDDDDAFRSSVSQILRLEDYDVVDVSDGKDALPYLKSNSVDLVITDILMPEVEGNELATKIKEQHPDLSVIGMTGGGRIGDAETVKKMCLNNLFHAVLKKPFVSEELLNYVKEAIA